MTVKKHSRAYEIASRTIRRAFNSSILTAMICRATRMLPDWDGFGQIFNPANMSAKSLPKSLL